MAGNQLFDLNVFLCEIFEFILTLSRDFEDLARIQTEIQLCFLWIGRDRPDFEIYSIIQELFQIQLNNRFQFIVQNV